MKGGGGLPDLIFVVYICIKQFLWGFIFREVAHIVTHLLVTHMSLASFLWDIGKLNSPRCDATNMASNLGLFCLLT